MTSCCPLNSRERELENTQAPACRHQGAYQSGCLVCAREWLYLHLRLELFSNHSTSLLWSQDPSKEQYGWSRPQPLRLQEPGYPRDSYSYAVACWPGHCSFLLCGFLCLYLDPITGTGNAKYIRHTATLHGQSISSHQGYDRLRTGSMLRGGSPDKKVQRQHIHFLWLLEHMTHKLATLKEQKCSQLWGLEVHSQIVGSGGSRGEISSSGFGGPGSPWLVATSLQPVFT